MIASLLLLLAAAGAGQSGIMATPPAVPARWHLIEGIASDGQQIWLSSVVDRQIVALDPDGDYTAIPLPDTMGAPFGLAWDDERQWLWVAAMCPAEPEVAHCGHSGLFALDRMGKLHRSLQLEDNFNPGDVSVDAGRGRVFVSDSLNGAVYSCSGECTGLEPVVRPEGRASAQGSAVTADGRSLVVADYSRGIMLIDLASGAEQMVKTGDGKRLRGMDGLVRVGSTYVGIQNFANPAELIAFEIGEGGVLLNPRAAVISAPLGEATQLAVADDRLLVVADAQWRHYAGEDPKGADAQAPTPILSVPLSKFAP